MGIFSKIWKGIKKVGKKIAKGVKKTFKKIGAAIGKLGVVGQIGMMFLMPYAMGALSSFAGSALGTVGQWSANLLSKSGIGAKALGHTLNMVHKAGTFAGKVYTTISDTIGNAVDRVGNFTKGEGFTLSEGKTSIFAKGNERSLLSTEGYALPDPITKDLSLTADINKKLSVTLDENLSDKLAKDLGIPSLSLRRISDIIIELEVLGLINFKIVSKGRYGRTRFISIGLPKSLYSEVIGILKEDLNLV